MEAPNFAPSDTLNVVTRLPGSSSTLFPHHTLPENSPTFGTGDGCALPIHWRNEHPGMWPWLRPAYCLMFKFLCLIAVGGPDLKQKWRAVNLEDGREFQEEKNRITTMVLTTNIVASLLLASTAALISTEPPRADIIDYNSRGPYLCLLCSFGIILGSIIVGCAVLFVLSTANAQWTRDTIMKTRVRIWIMLLLLAYPFLSIGVGTTVNFIGLLAAAWLSEDRTVNLGGAALLAVPVSLMVFFALITRGRAESTSGSDTDAEANAPTTLAPPPLQTDPNRQAPVVIANTLPPTVTRSFTV
ncbi:unnamed protein product [Peniophora sp. CBMAI 1063]|nr:unnamed protein product [Peniophora sp. CBMAI 1063]